MNDHLLDLLTKLWTLEEVPTKFSLSSYLSPEELECEQHFVETHTRTTSGKYVVKLPLKSSVDLLGESRTLAQRRTEHLLRRFDKDSIYKDLYLDFMKEFKTHGIFKLKNGIQKIRVVFKVK